MTSARRSLVLSFAEKYTTMAIQLVMIMAVSRILTPSQTGLYSVGAGIIAVAQVVRDFGVGNYIIQERELTRERRGAALWVSMLMGVAVALCFVAVAPAAAASFGEPELATIIYVMSINFFLVSIAGVGNAQLRRAMDYRSLTLINIGATVVHSSTSVVLALLGYGSVGMAWASVLGVSAGLVGNVVKVPDMLLLPPSFGEWRRVCGFGVLSMFGTVLGEIGLRAPDIVVGRMLGVAATGFFSRGNSLITLFESAFLNAVMSVSTATLARRHRAHEAMAGPALQMLDYVMVVAWPALAMLGLLSLPIITIMFGSQWMQSVAVGPPLCLAGACFVVSRSAAAIMTATGAVTWQMALQGAGVPLRIGGLAIGASFGFEQAAWGFAAAGVLHAAVSAVLIRRVIRAPLGEVLRPLGAGLAATAATLAGPLLLLLLLPFAQYGLILPTAAMLAAAAVGWGGWITLTGHPFREEARDVWRTTSAWRGRVAVAVGGGSRTG